jgi:hypothetical protein
MVPFFIQIKCKLGQSYVVANALAEAEIASEIYSTAGHFDLLVKFYVDAGTDIGHFERKGASDSGHPGHPHHHHLQGVRRVLSIALSLAYASPARASAPSMALSSISSENFLSLTARASCSAPTIIP